MPEPSTKSPKAYQFMFVLYPESQQPAIDYIQANWPCAWALHDKDTHTEQEFLDYGKHHDGNCPDWQIGDLKKPHYHFVVKFKNARYITGVQKRFASTPKSMTPQSRNATTCTKRMCIFGIRTTPTNSSMTRSRLLVCTTSTHLNRTRVSPRKNR